MQNEKNGRCNVISNLAVKRGNYNGASHNSATTNLYPLSEECYNISYNNTSLEGRERKKTKQRKERNKREKTMRYRGFPSIVITSVLVVLSYLTLNFEVGGREVSFFISGVFTLLSLLYCWYKSYLLLDFLYRKQYHRCVKDEMTSLREGDVESLSSRPPLSSERSLGQHASSATPPLGSYSIRTFLHNHFNRIQKNGRSSLFHLHQEPPRSYESPTASIEAIKKRVTIGTVCDHYITSLIAYSAVTLLIWVYGMYWGPVQWEVSNRDELEHVSMALINSFYVTFMTSMAGVTQYVPVSYLSKAWSCFIVYFRYIEAALILTGAISNMVINFKEKEKEKQKKEKKKNKNSHYHHHNTASESDGEQTDDE